MRIFKRPWFSRFAAKEGIPDNELKDIVNNVLESDLAEANLGGGVYKVCVAKEYLAMSDTQLKAAVESGKLSEL